MSLRSRSFRLTAVVLCLLIVTGAAALFVAPPRTITRALALAGSRWLVRDDGSDNRIATTARRIFTIYIQYAVAAQVASDLGLDELDEERALCEAMQYVRTHTLNHLQYAVEAENVGLLVRGAGSCDQINAAVATIAAHRFDDVQIVAVYDPVRKLSPHTVGRVWSAQRGEWIYFDALFAEAVMYTIGPRGRRQFLEHGHEPIPSRQFNGRDLYDKGGYVLSGFPSTFGGYLLARTFGPDPQVPEGAGTGEMLVEGPELPATPSVGTDDDAFDHVADAFVKARMDHLFGARPGDSYRKIASDPHAGRDDRAAEIAWLAKHLGDLTGESTARAANE